jgi:hypothetical protein
VKSQGIEELRKGRIRERLLFLACGGVEDGAIFRYDAIESVQLRENVLEVIDLAPGDKNRNATRSLEAPDCRERGGGYRAFVRQGSVVVTSEGEIAHDLRADLIRDESRFVRRHS